jgi:hypothetical protein
MTKVITRLCKTFKTPNVFTVANGQLCNSDSSTSLPKSSYTYLRSQNPKRYFGCCMDQVNMQELHDYGNTVQCGYNKKETEKTNI